MDLNEINKDVAFNQLKQRREQLVKSLGDKYTAKSVRLFDNAVGKTIEKASYDSCDMALLLRFTDGTYLNIEYVDDYGSRYLTSSELSLPDLIEHQMMDPEDVKAYERVHRECREMEVQRSNEQALKIAIAKVGKDRARELLN